MAQTKLDEYLGSIQQERADAVRERLDCLANYRGSREAGLPGAQSRTVQNVWIEPRLNRSVWAALRRHLKSVACDPKEVHGALTAWARENGHSLAGSQCRLGPGAVYASCASVGRFLDQLLFAGDFDDADQAESWLDEVVMKTPSEQAGELAAIRLKEHQMWATLNPGDPCADPLAALPNTANGIRACLGLALSEKSEPLIVLRYTLPVGVRPRFPTVTTACASEPWSEFFAINAAPNAKWGMTQRWPGREDAWSSPEVVHEPIAGETLAHELRISRPAGAEGVIRYD